jgi:hypothetical protein
MGRRVQRPTTAVTIVTCPSGGGAVSRKRSQRHSFPHAQPAMRNSPVMYLLYILDRRLASLCSILRLELSLHLSCHPLP